MFTPDPIQRPAGPPASSTPIHDYFASPRPGTDANYVVLPRSLVEAMPLPWQQHMTYLLAEFHQAFSHVTWPVYRVQPSRHEKLTDLDEDQLAEVGYFVEIDGAGDVVYRDRSGHAVERPGDMTVLVSCLDPIPPPRGTSRPAGPRPGPPEPQQSPPRGDDPSDTPPSGFPVQQGRPPAPPGQPFGPTGYQAPGRRTPNQGW